MITKKILHIEDDPTRRSRKGSSGDEDKALKSLSRGGKRLGVIGPSMHVSKSNPQGNRRSVAARPAGASPRARWQHKKDFNGLGDYMLEGDKQPGGGREYPDGKGRIGTAYSVNVGVADDLVELTPDQVRETAAWMGSTAALNNRIVKSAVMHYVMSVPEEDASKATPELWRAVGPRVLEALGMEEHEALFVSHIETDNPHLHIMINRVHPSKETVVDPLRDLIRLEALNRTLEKEFHLKVEKGRHIDPDTGKTYDWDAVRRGEIKVPRNRPRMTRVEMEKFARQVKADLVGKPFSTSSSWNELEDNLKQHGYHLRPEGRGLKVCSDDGHEVKLTKIAGKGNGREKLEERFEEKWNDWCAIRDDAEKQACSIDVVRMQRQVRVDTERMDQTKVRQAKADILKHNVASIWTVGPDTRRCGVEWGCESETELRSLISPDVMSDTDLNDLWERTRLKNEEAKAGMKRTANKYADALRREGEVASHNDWFDTERGTRNALLWLEEERKNRGLGLPKADTVVVDKAPTKVEPFFFDKDAPKLEQTEAKERLKALDKVGLEQILNANPAAIDDVKKLPRTPENAKRQRMLTEGLRVIKAEFTERGCTVPKKPLARVKVNSNDKVR